MPRLTPAGPSTSSSPGVVSGAEKQTAMSPSERAMRARIAAFALHAKRDPRETTRAGREAFLTRFDHEVDPEGTLPEAERRRRAEAAKRAYFTALALRSARSRRRRSHS
jgi:hypothetical protein